MRTTATLPVWRTIADIYSFVAARPRELARIGWLPFVLLVAVSLASGTFEPDRAQAVDAWRDVQPVLVDWLLGAMFQGVIAVTVLVAWHRLVMRAHGVPIDHGPVRRLSLPGRRELLYFVQMLGLSVMFLAVFAGAALVAAIALHLAYWMAGPGAAAGPRTDTAFVAIGYAAILVGLLPAFYVALRLSLALPQTAVGERRGCFTRSWEATRGNGWRMAAITLLAMLPVDGLNIMLSWAARTTYGSVAHYPAVSATCLGLVLLMVVLGSALTKCYLSLAPSMSVPAARGIPEAAT